MYLEGLQTEFQRGYKDEQGNYHKDFDVVEINGHTEEAISRPEIKNNAGKVVRTILERCITRIGTYTKKEVGETKWREIIQSLSVGDQDIALVRIRVETLGEDFEMSGIICPDCKSKLDLVVNVDELKIKAYEGVEEIDFELPKGYRDGKGEIHKFGKLRIPNGLDREVLIPVAMKNVSAGNTLMLSRCMTELEGTKVTDNLIRNLSLKDREYLGRMLSSIMFGYELKVDATCIECGESFTTELNLVNFL